MSDTRTPRKCQVVLLDERKLDFLVQPPLLVSELLDMVSSHINLHEKEYFGLYHTDDIGNKSWFNLDRKVLDHDLPRYADPVLIYFAVRLYVPTLSYFKEKVTIELFYLQAKSLIFKGSVHCKSDVVFKLGAHVLQAMFGDFSSDENARIDVKKVSILPTRTLKEHPSITYCEDMVIGHYRELKGVRRGQAIVEYLHLLQSIPTFGVHYYEVKDKGSIPWWIGISSKGVGVYDHSDKTKPRKLYQWHQINNLHFKERKFSLDVKNLRKISEVSVENGRARSNSLGRRTNQEQSIMHTWYANTIPHAKAIWSMAISQHSFFMDLEDKMPKPRALSDIANELSRSTGSLNSSLASVVSDCSDPSESCTSSNGGDSGLSTEVAQREMANALAARKEALQARLKEKVEELRTICFQEATITGEYPPETPHNPVCPPPPVRRRVGTSFTFSDFAINDDTAEQREERLETLQRDFEILSKITDAAEKLANDAKASKNVKKSRKLTYQKSFSKLKSVEQAIKRLKESQNEKLENNNLPSYGDDVDGAKPTLSRRDSFNAATRQQRATSSNSLHVPATGMPNGDHPNTVTRKGSNCSTESFHSTRSSPPHNFKRNGKYSDEDLSNNLDILTISTPEFASSTKINDIVYLRKSNSSLSSNYRGGYRRSESNSSISSFSSVTSDRPPPPSYAQSRFSRREFPRAKLENNSRGSTSGLHNHVDGVNSTQPNIENQGRRDSSVSSPTKVRYMGGLNSSGQTESECSSDDTSTSRTHTSELDYDNNFSNYWLKTATRNRANIATAHFNHPNKLGIMSTNESTGSYFVNELFPNARPYSNKAHHASTSDLNIERPPPRPHNSCYSLNNSPVAARREPLMRRFFQDSSVDWSDGDDGGNITLV